MLWRKWFQPWTLSSKVNAIVLVATALVFVPLAWVTVDSARRHMDAMFVDKAKSVARLLDASIHRAEELKDAEAVLGHIHKVMWLEPDVVGLSVNRFYDEKLRTSVSDSGQGVGEPADPKNEDAYRNDRVLVEFSNESAERTLRIIVPIHLARRVVGTYDLRMTLDAVDTQLRGSVLRTLLILVTAAAILYLILSQLWNYLLVRRIRRQISALSAVGAGEMDVQIPIDAPDELGQMARAFNRMTMELQRTHVSLEARTAALETEMAAREILDSKLRDLEKIKATGQLAGGMAHEFNNLLQIVSGSLDLLEADVGSSGQAVIWIQEARRSVRRGAELTERMLSFSRRQTLHPERTEVKPLFALVGGVIERLVGERITLTTDVSEHVMPLFIDAAQFESALVNLAINARDAMPDGGTLTITARNTRIDAGRSVNLDGVVPGEFIEIEVVDNGEGMSQETLGRAFEPFYTTKGVGRGTGLGLSMVFGFCRQSGGFVEITSEPGAGTKVRMYFPVAVEAGESPERRESAPVRLDPPRPMPLDPERVVLVVEDDLRVLRLNAAVFGTIGFKVLQATSTEHAEVMLETHPEIGLLFSDIVMPGERDGLDLARRWRNARPELRILLTSGYSGELVDERVAEGHAASESFTVLRKPFDIKELVHAVSACMGRPTLTLVRDDADSA